VVVVPVVATAGHLAEQGGRQRGTS